MSYASHFKSTNDILTHLTSVIATCPPLLEGQYAGFAAVSSVTVYELAIKEIFQTFAASKHTAFGTFTEHFFARLNGRIKLDDLRNDYLPRFGGLYRNKFDTVLEESEIGALKRGKSVKTSYSNLLTWRHSFAHSNNSTCTFSEVVEAYELGKRVIDCLHTALNSCDEPCSLVTSPDGPATNDREHPVSSPERKA